MGFIQTDGSLIGVAAPAPAAPLSLVDRPRGIVNYSTGFVSSYEAIYKTQPNVRTVVDFLGRNVAQLAIKLFERVSDDERRYRRDHPLDRLMRRPVAGLQSRYAWVRWMVNDLGVFDNFVALKVRGGGRLALLRVPPQHVEPIGRSWAFAEAFRVLCLPGNPEFARADVVHLYGYNPGEARWGLSPIETLRRLLAEDAAAGTYREQLWSNGARIPGVIERPLEAPPWRDAARERFKEDFAAAFSGLGPEAGTFPILEDGMSLKSDGAAFNAQELEYLGARKLTRSEVAAAYHVDPSMVGVMDNANIANADAAHRRLYQDTLAPLTAFVEEELTLQLLPEFETGEEAFDRFYLETNLEEKLRGDFLAEAEAASRAVGGPWMTRNEYRARRNLPPDPDGDGLIIPLNVTIGGRASPADTAPGTPGAGQAARALRMAKALEAGDDSYPPELAAYFAAVAAAIADFVARQSRSALSKLGAGDTVNEALGVDDLGRMARWDDELAGVFLGYALTVAPVAAGPIADFFGIDYNLDVAEPWLTTNARIAAEGFNDATLQGLADEATRIAAGEADASFARIFELAAGGRADLAGQDRVTQVANFARHDAAHQAGAGEKTWIVTSRNSRHPELNGETVAIGETFSNGGLWPRDPALPSDQSAGCRCIVEFSA